jgi:hypothetical protein
MTETMNPSLAPTQPNALGRIASAGSNLQASREVVFKCSPLARVMRRDWSLVSYRVARTAQRYDLARTLQDCLLEFQTQANELQEQVSIPLFQELPLDWLSPVPMQFPIIHRYMAHLLRTFEHVDHSYALLLSATREGLITRQRQHQIFAPIIYVYGSFKATALQQTSRSLSEVQDWD